ncbi:MAG: hypothetical protein AAGC72_01965 [Planctomycetota bacterium]
MEAIKRTIQSAALCILMLVGTGCISTGETIRITGEVVGTDGERITDAVVIAKGSKRGGTIIQPGEWENPESVDESRQAVVEAPGDGTFTASSRWAGTLTLKVQGYRIRRVDELGTEFLVPNRSFFQSQDQVRLEVVKDESANGP